MNMEKEDGEVVDVFQSQEYYPASDSLSNEQKQQTRERKNERSEDRWKNMASQSFHKVVVEIFDDLRHSGDYAYNRVSKIPSLPILPSVESNNYEWTTWNSWYQNLSGGERQLLSDDIKDSFSLLISKSSSSTQFYACLLAPNSTVLLDVLVECPLQAYSTLNSLPDLEGILFAASPQRIMLNEFKQQLHNVLSSKPNRLFVFSLSSSFLSLLGFDDFHLLCIRDLNRFPLIPSSCNISRKVHDLFVTPTTPITIFNPYDQLMKYLTVLNIKIQFLDIPILTHPRIKWIRYSLSYKNITLLVGYCIADNEDKSFQRASFAVLRHLWGIQPPLLYKGDPSRDEMEKLDFFIQCVMGKSRYSFPQATGLLQWIYDYCKKEMEYSLTMLAPEEIRNKKKETIPVSLPTPSPLAYTSDSSSGKRPFSEVSNQVIALPDLTISSSLMTNENKLILIVDIDLTILHAIHDEDSITFFNIWLSEESSSRDEQEWKQSLRQHLKQIDISNAEKDRYSSLLIKVRPGVVKMLNSLSQYYELMVYTQGEEQYAKEVLAFLDPSNKLFKKRFIARKNELEPEKKSYLQILNYWNETMNDSLDIQQLIKRLVILDDKIEVWEQTTIDNRVYTPQKTLFRCFPYHFFNTKSSIYEFLSLKQFETLENEYINRVNEIFLEMAKTYYQGLYDISTVFRNQKRKVFKGLRIAFTSIIERSEILEENILYLFLVDMGGVYVPSVENDCDILICRNVRTAKVNAAQQKQIPVVSVCWIEECIRYWKMISLDPYYMDFAQDINQTAIMGKSAIIAYHQKAKDFANTSLFSVTDPPPAYLSLVNKEKEVLLKDFDDEIWDEILLDKKPKIQSDPTKQFSPSVNVVIDNPNPLYQSNEIQFQPYKIQN